MSTKRQNYVAYLLIAPSFTIYLIFVLIPLFTGLIFSFTNYDLYKTMDFVGLKNYRLLLGDSTFKQSIYNTFIYSVFTILPQMVIGLVLAAALSTKIKGRNIFRAGIYIPNVTSMVAISMVWTWIYEPSLGILNRFMSFLGMDRVQWLFDVHTAMGCIIVMSIWRLIGYNMVIYLAGINAIPKSMYEAAMIDGASVIQRFFRMTLPLLRPTTFFLFVTACISSFNVFEQVTILTNGGPMNTTTTIVHQIYLRAFQDLRMGYASSMAMVLCLIMVVITLVNFRFGNQGNDMDMD